MKISVIIWIYHQHLLMEFLPLIKKNNLYPVFGLCNELDNKETIKIIKENFDKCIIHETENKGRDILSFLQILKGIESPYFIKIHTKLDDEWRLSLIEPLFKNLEQGIDILNKQQIVLPWGEVSKNDIGMIASANHIVSNHEHTNTNQIKKICSIIGIDYDQVKNGRYVSGTMFMSRTDLFKKYFNSYTIPKIIPLLENGNFTDSENGTFTHALERIFGYIITAEKMRIKSIK